MRIFGKPTARQKEIRRTRAERGLTWRHRIQEQLQFQPLTFLLFCGMVTAWIAVKIFLKLVENYGFKYFGYYRIAIGIVFLIVLL